MCIWYHGCGPLWCFLPHALPAQAKRAPADDKFEYTTGTDVANANDMNGRSHAMKAAGMHRTYTNMCNMDRGLTIGVVVHVAYSQRVN